MSRYGFRLIPNDPTLEKDKEVKRWLSHVEKEVCKEMVRLGFYIPQYRWQFIEWFKQNRPHWKGFSKWPLKQCRAVYIRERKAHG